MKLFGASLITLGLISSFVFFIIALILIYTDSLNVWLAVGLTIIFNFVMWLVGPWFTDWINKFFYKVRFLTPEDVTAEYPQIAMLITQICTEYNFKFPKIGVIPDNNPTAFTYGSGRYNSRLVVTKGLFKYLNENEQRAVVGHEMGHIVNRDFIVMMIASTLIQILYEMYASLSRGKGNRKGNAAIIGLAAYVLYLIGTYLLLFLSRTRELLADKFSASITEPEDLSNALIKIAYGIVSEADSDSTTRLLQSTRHMGLVDVKDAKHTAGISYVTNNDSHALSEAMLFDTYSPWAKIAELNSTHPLTGRRVKELSNMPSKTGRVFSFDVEAAANRVMLDKGRLWSVFFKDLLVICLPVVFAVAVWFGTRNLALSIAALGVGMIIKVNYRYPSGDPAETSILNEMRNPYASPYRGKSVALQGQAVGKGVPGYMFSEDMMYQDKTGLIFLDYHSAFSFVGNLIFALKKVKQMLGVTSKASGWFYRSLTSYFVLTQLEAMGQKPIKSYRKQWSYIWAFVVLAFGAGLAYVVYVETGRWFL